jgi:hypothetical protein
MVQHAVRRRQAPYARALDAHSRSTHNDLVRIRSILIVITLAVLAFAGLRQDHDRSIAPHAGSIASSQLSSQPAPDPEPPAIVKAAVTASATAQTHVACEPRSHERPVLDLSSDSRVRLHDPAYRASLPQSFPLLI